MAADVGAGVCLLAVRRGHAGHRRVAAVGAGRVRHRLPGDCGPQRRQPAGGPQRHSAVGGQDRAAAQAALRAGGQHQPGGPGHAAVRAQAAVRLRVGHRTGQGGRRHHGGGGQQRRGGGAPQRVRLAPVLRQQPLGSAPEERGGTQQRLPQHHAEGQAARQAQQHQQPHQQPRVYITRTYTPLLTRPSSSTFARPASAMASDMLPWLLVCVSHVFWIGDLNYRIDGFELVRPS